MVAGRERLLTSTFAILRRAVADQAEHDAAHPDLPAPPTRVAAAAEKRLLLALLWGMGGSMSLAGRRALAASIAAATTVELPPDCTGAAAAVTAAAGPGGDDGPSLLDYEVDAADGEWSPWLRRVPQIEMERPQSVLDTDLVVPTADTVRHEACLRAWLGARAPLVRPTLPPPLKRTEPSHAFVSISESSCDSRTNASYLSSQVLCGPPGSGKTMTLTATLQNMPDIELVPLNFSSATPVKISQGTFTHLECGHRPSQTLNSADRIPAPL